jgi:Ca2+-dependent lipid-binding protein
VFLLGSQATFIIGALNLSYAWCLIVIIATVPVWAREARLETLRIKYHTQEAIRVERMSEGMTESAEWLNFALDRYWQQFEPFLSSKIIDTLNESLRKYKPAILHSIEIVECTLGTRSPRIMDFQTSSRGEHSVMVSGLVVL